MTPWVETTEIVNVPPGRLAGSHIDSPTIGTSSGRHLIRLTGWALTSAGAPLGVEARPRNTWPLPLGRPRARPDVAAAFPDVPNAVLCGFDAEVSTLELERDFEIEIRAILDGQRFAPVGIVRGHRGPLPARGDQPLAPLLLTTVGRSGSTWLVRLLGEHPEVVAYQPFDHELRGHAYWISVLRALAQPRSFMRLLDSEISSPSWWLGAHGDAAPVDSLDPSLAEFLTGAGVEQVTDLCLGRAEALHRHVGEVAGKPAARYLVEKTTSGLLPQLVAELYPSSREIVLVRDPRDQLCSVLSFNAKRGYVSFGRELVSSDEDYVRWLRAEVENLVRHHRRSPRAILVRYEDLVTSPGRVLADLFRHLDLTADDATVAEVLARASGSPHPGEATHRTTMSARDSIGRWREDLDETLLEVCAVEFGGLLTELGYA